MKIEKLKTSKLFYNKWPYKVTCEFKEASRFINNRFWSARYNFYVDRLPAEEKAEVEKFKKSVDLILKHDVKHRVEYNHFNVFCDNKSTLEYVYKKMKPWVTHVYGPTTDEELAYLLNNGHKKRLCDSLPKDKFKYKIFFKTKMEESFRKNFYDWAIKLESTEKVDISPATKRWLQGFSRWTQAPFMYVEDSSTLSMVGLFLSSNVKVIEEFIPRESINTTSEC